MGGREPAGRTGAAGDDVEQPRKRRRAAGALDTSALNSLMGVHLRLANVALYHDFTKTMKPLAITQRQSAVLILIGTNSGASQTALARFLGINRATMMSMVDRLASYNLVERRTMNGDQRLRGLYLTRKGRETLAEVRKRISLHERKVFRHFSAMELEQFTGYLTRMHGKF